MAVPLILFPPISKPRSTPIEATKWEKIPVVSEPAPPRAIIVEEYYYPVAVPRSKSQKVSTDRQRQVAPRAIIVPEPAPQQREQHGRMRYLMSPIEMVGNTLECLFGGSDERFFRRN